jgi:mannitol operon transcriptional antiterminator
LSESKFNHYITPRQSKLLSLLLQNSYTSVNDLAIYLGIGRRTVWRELDNIEGVLNEFHLHIKSELGKGLSIDGRTADIQAFTDALNSIQDRAPASPEERRYQLLCELLASQTYTKLRVYADKLDVSEATIGLDLTALDEKIADYQVEIIRQKGLGIILAGSEDALRLMIIGLLLGHGNDAYVDEGVRVAVASLAASDFAGETVYLTAESKDFLRAYITVMVQRVRSGFLLTPSELTPTELTPPSDVVTEFDDCNPLKHESSGVIASLIESATDLVLPQTEIFAIDMILDASRDFHDISDVLHANQDVSALVYDMIDAFDQSLAPILKNNERLVSCLKKHLASTVVRLRQHIVLPDPMEGEILEAHPEIYEKSRQAVKVLKDRFAVDVPASEVSFISMHFGAAILELSEKKLRRKKLTAAVLCVAGIGASYLMRSQLRNWYNDELDVFIGDITDTKSLQNADFIISTIDIASTISMQSAIPAIPAIETAWLDISADIPIVMVNTVLKDEDHDKIRKLVDSLAFVKSAFTDKEHAHHSFSGELNRSISIMNNMKAAYESISCIYLDSASTFDEIVTQVSLACTENELDAARLETVLKNRETASSQVIEALDIVLLHARTNATVTPILKLFRPIRDGDICQKWEDPYLKNANVAIAMFIPEDASKDLTDMMGIVSSALVEDDHFLEAICQGDIAEMKYVIEQLWNDFIRSII